MDLQLFVQSVHVHGEINNKTDRHDVTELLFKVALKHH